MLIKIIQEKATLSYRRSKLDNGGVLGVFTKIDVFSKIETVQENTKQCQFNWYKKIQNSKGVVQKVLTFVHFSPSNVCIKVKSVLSSPSLKIRQ